MKRADVAVVVLDASVRVTHRDAAIAGEAERAGCGIVYAANKWDLVKGREEGFAKRYDQTIHDELKFADYAPIVHLSALTGARAPKLLEAGRSRSCLARLDQRSQSLSRACDQPASSLEPEEAGGQNPVRHPNRSEAAPLCALHEYRNAIALFLRAVPQEPLAGVVRVRRNPPEDPGPRPPRPSLSISRPVRYTGKASRV